MIGFVFKSKIIPNFEIAGIQFLKLQALQMVSRDIHSFSIPWEISEENTNLIIQINPPQEFLNSALVAY